MWLGKLMHYVFFQREGGGGKQSMDVPTKKHGNGTRRSREEKLENEWATNEQDGKEEREEEEEMCTYFMARGAAAPQKEKVPTNMSGENAVPRAESGRH